MSHSLFVPKNVLWDFNLLGDNGFKWIGNGQIGRVKLCETCDVMRFYDMQLTIDSWDDRMPHILRDSYVHFFFLHYMLLVRRFYPKWLTYSILWTISTGAIWGEVSCPGTQRHADCSVVWTCDPLIRTPTHNPLRHTPPMSCFSLVKQTMVDVCKSASSLVVNRCCFRPIWLRSFKGAVSYAGRRGQTRYNGNKQNTANKKRLLEAQITTETEWLKVSTQLGPQYLFTFRHFKVDQLSSYLKCKAYWIILTMWSHD